MSPRLALSSSNLSFDTLMVSLVLLTRLVYGRRIDSIDEHLARSSLVASSSASPDVVQVRRRLTSRPASSVSLHPHISGVLGCSFLAY